MFNRIRNARAKRTTWGVAVGLATLAVTLCSACTGETKAADASPGEPDDVTGTTSQALGEAACATVAITSTNGAILSAPDSAANSPDDQYNPAGCPKQFVVEVTGLSGTEFVTTGPSWGDEPLPSTAAECANARSIVSWYAYHPAASIFQVGHWDTSLAGQMRYQGIWDGSPAHCTLVPVSGYPTGAWPPAGYAKFRVAMQNWQWVNGKPDYKFAGLSRITGPK